MPVPLAAVLRAGLVLCALVRFARSDTAFLTTGDCSASESCVSSPNYPSDYDDYGTCTITPQVSGVLSVTNFSTEAGVYLRFIVDHYHDLPDITIFVHARPEEENAHWRSWVKCLRSNMSWASLSPTYVLNRSPLDLASLHARQLLAPRFEQCWRDLARVFAISMPPPTEEPRVSMLCCQTFAASREQLRSRPLQVWQQAYQLVLRPVCHQGPLDQEHL